MVVVDFIVLNEHTYMQPCIGSPVETVPRGHFVRHHSTDMSGLVPRGLDVATWSAGESGLLGTVDGKFGPLEI